jgi:hypothetical protein
MILQFLVPPLAPVAKAGVTSPGTRKSAFLSSDRLHPSSGMHVNPEDEHEEMKIELNH